MRPTGKPYAVYEYLYSGDSFVLVGRDTTVQNLKVFGTLGIIPDYCTVNYAAPFEQFEKKVSTFVQAVIDIGHVMEQSGIVEKYHVGGHVRQKSLLF